MKKYKLFFLCLLSVLVFTAFGSGTAFARWKSYSFHNHSGRIIKYLYITSSGSGDWGGDLLGSEVLGSGDSVSLRYNDDVRFFDVKVVFSDGSDVTFWKADYKNVWRKTIFHRGGTTYTLSSN